MKRMFNPTESLDAGLRIILSTTHHADSVVGDIKTQEMLTFTEEFISVANRMLRRLLFSVIG